MPLSSTKTVNLDHCEIILRSDDIIQVNAQDHDYTLLHILEIHDAIKKLSKGKKVWVLLVATKFTSIVPEARNYLSTPEANLHTFANAFVIQSLAQRIIINFMIKVQTRPVPTRFFTSIDDAAQWIYKLKFSSGNLSV